MSSPAKRPAVTYNRRSTNKIAALAPSENESTGFQASALLNPDAALQEKINSVLFSDGSENKSRRVVVEEEEFDSAYHETIGNAKKVHDLVQSGETRRFIDEIEYLLDGISDSRNSNALILSSLQEIIDKCFDPSTNKVNVSFAMKLKSHGALGIIFESLQSETDPRVLDVLVVLVVGLLYDVRRMDFFFKAELALKLIKYCFNKTKNGAGLDILKASQLFTNLTVSEDEIYDFVAIWILYKWTFSSLTSKNNSSFFTLLKKEPEIIKKVISIVKEGSEEIGKKASGLLDYLIINLDMKEFSSDLISLLKDLIKNRSLDISFMKLAVSITGSPLFGKHSEMEKEEFFELIQNFTELATSEGVNEDVAVLAWSCLINLIDRCNDSFIDEFRYQKSTKKELNLIELYTEEYKNKDDSHVSTLLVLLLGFICRQNRTNLQVMLSKSSPNCDLKKEIFTVASNFYLQQEKSLKRGGGTEDSEIIIERLNEIILTFKP